MQLFYCADIRNTLFLNEQESFHAAKVLRLTSGEDINIVDGMGGWYQAKLTSVHPKKCEFNIVSSQQIPKKKYSIHIAIAPVKSNDRNEWFVEKAIEFGIDEISFIECNRSEKKGVNIERIGRIALSAMKQSLKAYLPSVNASIPFKNFVEKYESPQKFIPHLDEGEKVHLMNAALCDTSYLVLIGPEGDFTNIEVKYALQNGYKAVTLGNSRLRTETAGIASCHILNLINERLHKHEEIPSQ